MKKGTLSKVSLVLVMMIVAPMVNGLDPGDDKYSYNQWQMKPRGPPGSLDCPPAWEMETGRNSIVVAVIDNGVALTHYDLVDNIWENDGEFDGTIDNDADDDGEDEPGIDGVDDDNDGDTDFDDQDVRDHDYNGNGLTCYYYDEVEEEWVWDLDDKEWAAYDEFEAGYAGPGIDNIDDDEDGQADWDDVEVRNADYDNDGKTTRYYEGGQWKWDKGDMFLALGDDDENGLLDDLHGWDFVDEDNTVGPDEEQVGGALYTDYHGTACAGIIGADLNNYLRTDHIQEPYWGIAGMAQVSVMPLVVYKWNDPTGGGTDLSDLEFWTNVLSAVEYATDKGADIISMSIGGKEAGVIALSGGDLYDDLEDAFEAAWNKDILMVAGSGNWRPPTLKHLDNQNPAHAQDELWKGDDEDLPDFIHADPPSWVEGWETFAGDPESDDDFPDDFYYPPTDSSIKYHKRKSLDIDENEVDEVLYPACSDWVIAVGASNVEGERCSYSFFEDGIIEVLAPSGDLGVEQPPGNPGAVIDLPSEPLESIYTTTSPKTGFGHWYGTSFSAPHVSGLAALIWSVHPRLSNNKVRSIISSSCRDITAEDYIQNPVNMNGYDKYSGWGIIDPPRALEYAALQIDNDAFEVPIELTQDDAVLPQSIIDGHSIEIDSLGRTHYVYSSNINDAQAGQGTNPNHKQQIHYEVVDRNGKVQAINTPWITSSINNDAVDPWVYCEPAQGEAAHVVWRGEINLGQAQPGEIYYQSFYFGNPLFQPAARLTTNGVEEGPPKIVMADPTKGLVVFPTGPQNVAVCQQATSDQTDVSLGLHKAENGHYLVNIVWQDDRHLNDLPPGQADAIYHAVYDLDTHQMLTPLNGIKIEDGPCTYMTMATEFDLFNNLYGTMHLAWVTSQNIFYRRTTCTSPQTSVYSDTTEKVALYSAVFNPGAGTPYTGQQPEDLSIETSSAGAISCGSRM